jgi:hypothetical protein
MTAATKASASTQDADRGADGGRRTSDVHRVSVRADPLGVLDEKGSDLRLEGTEAINPAG